VPGIDAKWWKNNTACEMGKQWLWLQLVSQAPYDTLARFDKERDIRTERGRQSDELMVVKGKAMELVQS
jgi:hypothetical protein